MVWILDVYSLEYSYIYIVGLWDDPLYIIIISYMALREIDLVLNELYRYCVLNIYINIKHNGDTAIIYILTHIYNTQFGNVSNSIFSGECECRMFIVCSQKYVF